MNGQFTQIQTKVLYDKRLKSRDRDILLLLQSMVGLNGYCWPSYNHIADKLGISRKTAIEAIKKLEKLNYVIKVERTIDGTMEQTTNKYYVNNNPDAGDVVKKDTPPNSNDVVQKLHHTPVQNLHPEKDKFFEKNARACARTREGENDTPNDKTESGSLPVAEPDSLQNVNCPKSSEDEDIRLWREVNDEWKRAFKKSLWIFGEVVKTKQRQGFSFRPFRNHAAGFDFDWLNVIFSEKTSDSLNYCEFDRHFADERVINYDG